ncbi:hypothetical protein [Streptomyces sp. NPDC017890]|uniref:hypothetical protein n=1 Tax=Streptomyces sp. NPDC017890 TaxID=3365015 RepID=UPI00379A5222
MTPRHTNVVGDLALLIVDFAIAGTAAHSGQVHIGDTATDMARRGPDGYWRYVIDNPFGVASPPEQAAFPGSR